MFRSPLGHVYSPAWTSLEKLGVPSPTREREQGSSPAWEVFCHGGIFVGRTPPKPRRVRLEDGCPTRPTPEFLRPCEREREPHLPSPVGQARKLPFRAGTQTPKQRPRGGLWDSRGLSGSRGLLPGRLPVPRGLRVGASHGSQLVPWLCPARARRRAGPTWTRGGEEAAGREEGWGEGWAGVAGSPASGSRPPGKPVLETSPVAGLSLRRGAEHPLGNSAGRC